MAERSQKPKAKLGAGTAGAVDVGRLWARRALWEYCFLRSEQRVEGDESATRKDAHLLRAMTVLQRQAGLWSQHHAFFLVRLLFPPSQLPHVSRYRRKILERHVAWLERTYRRQPRDVVPGTFFHRFLARAYVFVRGGLDIPDAVWDDEGDALSLCIAEEVLAARRRGVGYNEEQVLTGPAAERVREHIRDHEENDFTVAEALVERRIYEPLRTRGLPPPRVVSEHMGGAAAQSYRERLEAMESDALRLPLSTGCALETGAGRARWSQREVEQALDLFNLICDALLEPDTDASLAVISLADSWRDYVQRTTRAATECKQERRAQAAALPFWRVKPHDADRWRDELTASEWMLYATTIEMLPIGVGRYMRTARFNAANVAAMRATNLPAMTLWRTTSK